MVLNMDINKHMYIWINSIFKETKEAIIVDGNEYDNEFGFGLNNRTYLGDYLEISKNFSIKKHGEIDIIHYSHGGFKWYIENTQSELIIPFLLTSDIDLCHIFSGEIQLEINKEVINIFSKFPNSNFPIISDKCIGNLNIKEGKYFYIDVFSNLDINNLDILKEKFCFPEFTNSIGKVFLKN